MWYTQGMALTHNNNNNNNNNNHNNRIHRCNSKFFSVSSLRRKPSPTHTLKWPGRYWVQITCNTSSACHVQHSGASAHKSSCSFVPYTLLQHCHLNASISLVTIPPLPTHTHPPTRIASPVLDHWGITTQRTKTKYRKHLCRLCLRSNSLLKKQCLEAY